MSKISKITIQNFKSITDFSADFKGATAIITGGNNKGKTSFLRGIPDRIRFIRPDVMVKEGEKDGRGEMILDSGERFIWEFDTQGRDKLTYITTEGRASVTKELGSKFFPPVFDIDKFLQSSPKQQVKQLQAIVGIDFTNIDEEYKKAYDARTERNREAELYHVKLEKMLKCEFVAKVDLTDLLAKKEKLKSELNAKYTTNKANNQSARKLWEDEKSKVDKEVSIFNQKQLINKQRADEATQAHNTLVLLGLHVDHQSFTKNFVETLYSLVQKDKNALDIYPNEPTYIEEMPDRAELDKIDLAIVEAIETNSKAAKYQEYIDHVKATEDARGAADDAHQIVCEIEDRRKKMVESASFPKGISITSEGILVDGLPLDKNQISTSKLYCAALRIASMNLGEVKTLYFDASFLDKNTLSEIQVWANENDLQLLIERPDWEGNDISYEIIEK